MIIAIDGPAGSGKSTVSKALAKELGVLYLDTGAMYRALTLKAMRAGLDLEDEEALIAMARSTKLDLADGAKLKVLLDGEDVAGLIRSADVTRNTRYIACVSGVRQEMAKLQRAIGRRQGAVLEGRDIGTVVFPDADYKFYLDADTAERASRRYKEVVGLGQDASLEEVKKEIVNRDESDMTRSVGALKVAEGAVVIDTTHMTVAEVTARILSHIKK
jgi:cytidylate kinase